MRERVALGAALIILSGVALLSYYTSSQALATLGWVEHTHRVLQEVDALNAAYSRAALARRSYIVAGDESQLGDLPALDGHLTEAIETLRKEVSDNPQQVERATQYERLTHERFADLQTDIDARRATGKSQDSPRGLELTLAMRSVREAMVNDENALLAERQSRTRRNIDRTKLVQLFGPVVSFIILIVLFAQLRGEVRRRRRSEEALRASEVATTRANAFLDAIVENMPHVVFVKEAAELRFERVNRAGEMLLKRSREELLGKSDFDFFPALQAQELALRDHKILEGRQVDDHEDAIVTPAGTVWLHTKKVPITDPTTGKRYLLGISEDVSERRRKEEELRQARDGAETANRELESFSYSVAHDLRAPLRGIDGFSQALLEDYGDKLDATGVDYLNRVTSSAKAMGELIDGLLALSRITRSDLLRQSIDLSAIARSIGGRLAESNGKRHVELVVQDGLVVEGDQRLLTAALENLMGNAWKFSAPAAQARVEVGSRQESGQTIYFVKDNGAGFDMSYVDKLFGAFQRLHGVAEFEGTGIGLATVQRIVRRHGGRIWAEGKVGAGATFSFTLDATRGGESNGQDHSAS